MTDSATFTTSEASDEDLRNLLKSIAPKPSPARLIRIGGKHDGAYLVPDDLEGVDACFSPGVNNFKYFEDELTMTYGIKCHMCDFSSDPEKFSSPLVEGMQTFEKKWLDVNGADNSISLEEWVARYSSSPGSDLILQIDIEGAEFRNLIPASEALMNRFRIIVIEIHGLFAFKHKGLLGNGIGPLIRKMDSTHVCVHAHPNNCCGEFVESVTGMNIPNVIELTYLRRDRFSTDSTRWHRPELPHPSDIIYNAKDKPRIHLNENWLGGLPRTKESSIKILQDNLDWENINLERLLAWSDEEHSSVLKTYRQSIENLMSMSENAEVGKKASSFAGLMESADDLARGKQFILSKNYADYPLQGIVSDSDSFFFHTAIEKNQSITIDLADLCQLQYLVIVNRLDMCYDRAACLFWKVHDTQQSLTEKFYPVLIHEDFLKSGRTSSITPLKGVVGRYITIFSPVHTALHFSSIRVYS